MRVTGTLCHCDKVTQVSWGDTGVGEPMGSADNQTLRHAGNCVFTSHVLEDIFFFLLLAQEVAAVLL